MKAYRQGEIIIIPIFRDSVPKYLKTKGDRVIREGETSGHLHELTAGELLVSPYRDNMLWLQTEVDTILTHPEHKPLTLPAGDYQIIIQREYSDEQNILVRD